MAKDPDFRSYNPDTPLRLDVAARMRFPDGSITGKSLRREAQRGKLAIFRIAGKDFTTLAAIDEMMRRCQIQQSDFASVPIAKSTSMPSEPAKRRSAQASLLAKLEHAKAQRKNSKSVPNNRRLSTMQ